jgi:hypothetical protein
MIDRLHRDVRVDVAHTPDATWVLDLEPSIGIEVGCDTVCHQVAFNSLAKLPDRFHNGGRHLLVRTGQPYEVQTAVRFEL